MFRRVSPIFLSAAICTGTILVGSEPDISLAAAEIPSRFVYPVISAPAENGTFPCLTENPSCGRESWYEEWDELQSSTLVQYEFIGPGLVSERRFAEAIRMLWQWPGGRELLRDAAAHGVLIRADSYKRRKGYAFWISEDREITINNHYADVSTWMLASVVGHELRHVIDPRTADDYHESTAECIDTEVVAHQFEQQYLRWIASHFGALPTVKQMKLLSKNDLDLYEDLAEIAAVDDLVTYVTDLYGEECIEP